MEGLFTDSKFFFFPKLRSSKYGKTL